MANHSLSYYVHRHAQGALTAEERETLIQMLRKPEYQDELTHILDSDWSFWETLGLELPESYAQVKQGVFQRIEHPTAARPSHRVHFLKTAWFRYAAAVILITGTVAYLWNTQKTKPAPIHTVAAVQDIPAPAVNRATITLANGQQIYLDSADSGILAVEGQTNIQKTEDGNIVYQGARARGPMQYNTLAVPRGSQVASIVLSDGTKVFLNAASALKYPVAFTGNERRVEITGEAYFEVAKNTRQPFIVQTGMTEVTVLGTHFNVNAYDDEEVKKVTLIEGSVKVSSTSGNVVIKPGQQIEVTKDDQLSVNLNADVSQVTAWQKGMFVFTQIDLNSMLRQVSRWYNVDIEYRGTIQSGTLSGVLSRRSPLSEIIKMLEGNGLNCTLEASKLIIEKQKS